MWVSARVIVFNAPFNNISVISWRKKPEYPVKTIELPQVVNKLNVVSSTPRLITLMMIGT
jgi:hypothetical protein